MAKKRQPKAAKKQNDSQATSPATKSPPTRTVWFDVGEVTNGWQRAYLNIKQHGFPAVDPKDVAGAFGISGHYGWLDRYTSQLIDAGTQLGVNVEALTALFNRPLNPPLTPEQWAAAEAAVSDVAWGSTGRMRPVDWRNKFCFDRWKFGATYTEIWNALAAHPEWKRPSAPKGVRRAIEAWAKRIKSPVPTHDPGRPRKAK